MCFACFYVVCSSFLLIWKCSLHMKDRKLCLPSMYRHSSFPLMYWNLPFLWGQVLLTCFDLLGGHLLATSSRKPSGGGWFFSLRALKKEGLIAHPEEALGGDLPLGLFRGSDLWPRSPTKFQEPNALPSRGPQRGKGYPRPSSHHSDLDRVPSSSLLDLTFKKRRLCKTYRFQKSTKTRMFNAGEDA